MQSKLFAGLFRKRSRVKRKLTSVVRVLLSSFDLSLLSFKEIIGSSFRRNYFEQKCVRVVFSREIMWKLILKQ